MAVFIEADVYVVLSQSEFTLWHEDTIYMQSRHPQNTPKSLNKETEKNASAQTKRFLFAVIMDNMMDL